MTSVVCQQETACLWYLAAVRSVAYRPVMGE